MDRLVFNSDPASQQGTTTTTDVDHHQQQQQQTRDPSRFALMYKNGDKLLQKQQQRRNEILSNRQSKRDKMVASIRRLVSEIASDEETTAQDDNSDDLEEPCEIVNNHQSDLPLANSQQQLQPHHHHLHHFHHQHQDTAAAAPNVSLAACMTSNNLDRHDGGTHMSAASMTATVKSSPVDKTTLKEEKEKRFRNKTMLSEWLVDRPMDLESEWVLRAIPAGRRCLIIAKKGETIAYSRTGKFIKAFQSALPGGSRSQITQCRRQFAIVDCIHVPNHNSFYLMDVLAWNQHKLYESEASLRFFWLQSRYAENKDKLLTVNSKNESRFYCLNTYPATDKDILKALHSDTLIKEHNLQLDGLLFFHIRGPYVPGANPLVLWIKPDMVQNVLNLSN